ncbi:hypothetical protein MTR_6g013320 [Medicago truncatula]|uniref:Uncharacterized protein n=1 Tax=Medicago truncatula TaxID=3880 RepID=Q2HWA6_MEDTR|nr:hypothetical protein MtrDRAFT_AC147482g25v2 [Medicago truncatula]AES74805.1 hypothetical protein MTR_6g013320 [Medicago truncatula]
MSKSDDEVTTKQTWVFEDVAFGGHYKNNFDLNKAPNEDGSSMSVCGEVLEVLQSRRVKNLRQKIVQPCERAFLDLNMENFDLNEVPVETMDSGDEIEELKDEELENGIEIEELEDEELENGLEIEELKHEELRKGTEDVLKIYIDSMN